MKTILINPPYCSPTVRARGTLYPLLGLAYILGVLTYAGYEARFIDALLLDYTNNDIYKIIEEEQPDIVGVTGVTKILKEGNNFVDVVVIEEDRLTMFDILNSLNKLDYIDYLLILTYSKDTYKIAIKIDGNRRYVYAI